MADVTKPASFLVELRKLASKVTDAADANKPIDATAAVKALKMFQDLDEALCKGGDAPNQWIHEKDEVY